MVLDSGGIEDIYSKFGVIPKAALYNPLNLCRIDVHPLVLRLRRTAPRLSPSCYWLGLSDDRGVGQSAS